MTISIAPPFNEEKLKSYTDWVERHGLDWKVLTEEDSEIVGGLLLCGCADIGTRPIRDKFEKNRYKTLSDLPSHDNLEIKQTPADAAVSRLELK